VPRAMTWSKQASKDRACVLDGTPDSPEAASSTRAAASLGLGDFQGMTAARCPRIYAARPVGDFSSVETSFLKGEPPYRVYR
jgi:hypothetical protein